MTSHWGMYIDLNCDVGEGSTPEQLEIEQQVMQHVTSVNVACGLHAGSPELMHRTVRLAAQLGLAVGAHPGFPDRDGFGRQEQPWTADAIESLIAYQVGALRAVATLERAKLTHVKPHGALYNMAGRDYSLALAVAKAVAAVDRTLILVGLAGSRLIEAGTETGLRVAAEAFVDRAYHRDGHLVSRSQPGAVVTDEAAVIRRVHDLIEHGWIWSVEGVAFFMNPDTICLHADTPGAPALARAIRAALIAAGISPRRLDHFDA
ncbi:MAG TPA: 5-oxoprolinase subunit PxpA [Nitrospiraceae bacterium]|nr:5-oxoprolinase subunit PxpA [Nitrospiraceae bacterium]